MTVILPVGVLVALVLLVVLVAGASDRRASRRRAESAAAAILGDDDQPAQRLPRTLIALVAVSALLGAIATGYAFAGRADQGDSNRADQAQTNLSRCQSTVATGWRKGIAVLLIGYTAGDEGDDEPVDLPPEMATVAEDLNLPDTLPEIRQEGRLRIMAALVDDARISDTSDRICPYVPGDPEATPDEPVRSATAALEQQLAQQRDATTTTTG